MPALKDNLLKFGVLRCRDLVELYYGWRMVANVTYTESQLASTQAGLLLAQDPRRIRYEISMTNNDVANLLVVTSDTIDNLVGEAYESFIIPPSDTIIVVRDFRSDLDAVCNAVFMVATGGSFDIMTRETFLTPAPVDELPLG